MRGRICSLINKRGVKNWPWFSLRLTVHPMETHGQQFGAKVSKIPLWIIEYMWTHKMADVLKDVDPSSWPGMDSRPLSLEDAGRLRVVSAGAFSVVRNRDVGRFENVLSFLEETHRLLPRLVAPVKHMKVVFGLKTMLIMWMLKQEAGMIDTMFKINQLFPSRLPQYQNQCNQREMFLMTKNHLDFKHLAQSLAMDKGKLERYMTNQMQQQYGDRYAQKVEDRLLQYLQKLETALPVDAYIDQLLKKESPRSEEEKLLLEVVSSDAVTIAATLKKLLHWDVTSLDLFKAMPEYRRGGPRLPKSPHCSPSLESNLQAATLKTEFQEQEEPADCDIRAGSPLLLENEKDLELGAFQRTLRQDQMSGRVERQRCGGRCEELAQESSGGLDEVHSSPQFCSKHRRWVRSILQECPEERSDDSLRQARASVSPPLFHSSSSRASSQDLTPSGLVPRPADQQRPARDACPHLQKKADSNGQRTSGSSLSFTLPLYPPQPASFRGPQAPVDRGGPEHSLKPHRALPSLLPGATWSPPENLQKAEADLKEPPAATTRRPSSPDGQGVSVALTRDVSTSTSTSAGAEITPLGKNSPVSSVRQMHVCSAPPPAGVVGGSPRRASLRLSLPSQAVLLQSRLLQPRVSLRRLSCQHLHRATGGRSSATPSAQSDARGDGTARKTKGEEDSCFSFDLNLLYSSRSSSSGGEDSALWDPDYEPRTKKTRLLPEYEATRTLV